VKIEKNNILIIHKRKILLERMKERGGKIEVSHKLMLTQWKQNLLVTKKKKMKKKEKRKEDEKKKKDERKDNFQENDK